MAGRRPSVVRVTGFGCFVAAFMLLAGATAAVLIGQFGQSKLAALISVGYSCGAVGFTVAALVLRGRR